MRIWMILLLLVSTLAALSVGVWYLGHRGDDGIEPALELPQTDAFVDVFYAKDDDTEYLLRPVFGDSAQDQFDAEQLNRMLGRSGAWQFARLWLINHSKTKLPFSAQEDSAFTMVLANGDVVETTALATLVAKDDQSTLTASDKMMLSALGGFRRKEVESNALVDLIIAMPSGIDLKTVKALSSPTHKVIFVVSKARRADLRQFISAPTGRVEELLITTEEASAEQAQASPK